MRDMTDPAPRPHPWAVTKATYTRPRYRLALITVWAMMLVALGSFAVGRPVVGLFFVIPCVAGNLALSWRVQRDLTDELTS
jgi:hypothetical protein